MANIPTSVRPLSSFTAFFEQRRGVPELWTMLRGGITEILGAASTGRTALAQWMIANASMGGEVVAVVDADDTFDPDSARKVGTDLGKLLWVQCGHSLDIALRAADLVLHNGGFGLIVLDLGDVVPGSIQRVPLSYWYRFQRAVEHTTTTLLIVAAQPVAKSCSVRQVCFEQQELRWRGDPPFQTIDRLKLQVTSRKPVGSVPVAVEALGKDVFSTGTTTSAA